MRNGGHRAIGTSASIRRIADRRRLAWLACCAAVALSACSQPGERPGEAKKADSDPWVTRGSIEAGPVFGAPPGPYSPRP